MSNVLYVCPEMVQTAEGPVQCKTRLFDMPRGGKGAKAKLKCRHHTDTLLEQAEDYGGPNFKYIDKDHPAPDATHVRTDPAMKPVNTVTVEPPPPVQNEEDIVRDLRSRYMDLYGEMPDMRFGAKRLNKLVNAELDRRIEKEQEEKRLALAELLDSDDDEYDDETVLEVVDNPDPETDPDPEPVDDEGVAE